MYQATFGSHTVIGSGGNDIFVGKIDTNGNWLWVTEAGGIDTDSGYKIIVDDAGNCYLTGWFNDTASFGTFSITSNGDYDIFIAKIDSLGNWLWATQAGGDSIDNGVGIAIDNVGNCYVTGCFVNTADFGPYSIISNGGWDIFVAKADANGNWLWASQAGGISSDFGRAITIDNTGNCIITGDFGDTASFGTNSISSIGSADIYVAKIDTEGNWIWVTNAGGIDSDSGRGIITDDNGNCYLTGYFRDTATFATFSIISSGYSDVFIAKMDIDGNWLWVNQAGGDQPDKTWDITIDESSNLFITGSFEGLAIFGAYSLYSSYFKNIFIAKIDANGYWQWAVQAEGTGDIVGRAITIDDAGNSYVTGDFEGTATFDSNSLTSSYESTDIFVAKLGNDTLAETELISSNTEIFNYPNPFNPTTTISFQLAGDSDQDVELSIYNIKGQKIKTLPFSPSQFPSVSVTWDGTDDNNQQVSSGIYFYKLKAGDQQLLRKMVLMK